MRHLARTLALRTAAVSIGMLLGAALSTQAADGADSVPSHEQRASLAAQRFPQPVRVGSLIDRRVLEPVESRVVLGHVLRVVRLPDGTVDLVLRYGGFLGWGGRTIAVPVDAVALLGDELVMIDFTAQQLNGLPPFAAAGAVPIAAGEQIKIGLTQPSH